MRRLEFLLPASLALCGAWVMWHSLARLTYYNHARGAPGPGFLPFWLAVGLVALGAILALRALRAAERRAVAAPVDPAARGRLRVVVAALVVALVAFEPLGFVASAVLLMLIGGYGLGLHAWQVLLPASLGVSCGLYALFAWLGVALPRGILPF